MEMMEEIGKWIQVIGIGLMAPFLLKIKMISSRLITIQEFKAPREILLALIGVIIFIIGCLIFGASLKEKSSPYWL